MKRKIELLLKSKSSRGVALVELLVVIVLSGLAVSVLMLSIQEGLKALETKHSLRRFAVLAESMMSEIRSKSYSDPENAGGAFGGAEESYARRNYDDVDDYDGLSNSPPLTIEGSIMANYAAMTVCVFVENVSGINPDAAVPEPDGSTDFKRIRVVVSSGKNRLSMQSVVSRYDR